MRYIADDGEIFDNISDCKEYERNNLHLFLNVMGKPCDIADDDVAYIHAVCPVSDFGIEAGNWAWDEGIGEWRDIDEYIDFLQCVAKRLKSGARQKYLAFWRGADGRPAAIFCQYLFCTNFELIFCIFYHIHNSHNVIQY